jgi:amino acid transporter
LAAHLVAGFRPHCRLPGRIGVLSGHSSLGRRLKSHSSQPIRRPAKRVRRACYTLLIPEPAEVELRRELGLRDLVLFNVAAVIGLRWLAAAAHTGPVSITLWLLAAVLFFIPSALAVATLSAKFPAEGGIYVWTRQAFGDWHGFLCGWCYWLSNLFYFPNLLLAGVDMAGYALGLAEVKVYVISTSLAVLWLGLLANLFGFSIAKWVNNAGGLANYAAGALIVVLGLAVWMRFGSSTPLRLAPTWDLDKVNFWSQIAFAFGGLELGAILGGEIRDPRRNVPRAAWISGSGIAAFYILGTLSLLVLMPPDRIHIMTGLMQAGTEAGARLGSAWLGRALTLLILLGVAGQLGAWIGGCARIPFVIGLDRYLQPAFARLHPRWGTPHVSLLAQGLACTVFVIALQAGEDLRIGYQLLVDMSVLTYFIPFAYLFATAWRFGRKWSAASGLFVTAVSMAVSLVPPGDTRSAWLFEFKLVAGCAALIGAAKIVFHIALRRR